jgi:hypothetical protein
MAGALIFPQKFPVGKSPRIFISPLFVFVEKFRQLPVIIVRFNPRRKQIVERD